MEKTNIVSLNIGSSLRIFRNVFGSVCPYTLSLPRAMNIIYRNEISSTDTTDDVIFVDLEIKAKQVSGNLENRSAGRRINLG